MPEWKQESDEELIRRYAQDNDRSAFEALLSRHYQQTYRLALKMLGDPAGADDAAQNAFVSLLRKAYRFEQGRPFRPWFYAIVMNAIRQEGRKRQRRQVKEQDAAVSELVVQRNWDEPFIREEIEKTLCYLSEEDRVAVILHFYEGKTHSDIAADLGIPKGTVSTRIRRGLNRLKTVMSKSGYGGSILGIEEALRNWPRGTEGAVIPNAAVLERRANSWLAQSIIVKATVVAIGAILISLAFLPELLEPTENPDEIDLGTAGRMEKRNTPKNALVSENDDRAKDLPRVPQGQEDDKKATVNAEVRDDKGGTNDLGRALSKASKREVAVKVKVLDHRGQALGRARVSVVVPDTSRGQAQYRNDLMHFASVVGQTNSEGSLLLRVTPKRLAGRKVFRLYAHDNLLQGHTKDFTLDDLRRLSEAGQTLTIELENPRKPQKGESALVLSTGQTGAGAKQRRLKGVLRRLDDSGFAHRINRSLTESGEAAIHELAPGSYRLTATLTGYAVESFDFLLKDGEATVSELKFPRRECVIRGSFADGSKTDQRGHRATLYSVGDRTLLKSVPVNRVGQFEFKGLLPGDYVVKVSHADYPGMLDLQRVRLLRPGISIRLKSIVFHSHLSVVGVLVDSTGRPIPSLELALVDKSLGVVSTAQCSKLGTFEFRGVKAGRYFLELSGRNRKIISRAKVPEQGSIDLGELELTLEGRRRRFLVSLPSKVKGSIQCQLSGPGHLQKLSSNWRPNISWVSKRPGLVYFQAKVADSYFTPLLPLQLKEGELKTIAISRLEKGGALSGRLSQLQGLGGRARVTLRRVGRGLPFSSYQAIIGASGQFQFQNIAPGSYQLSVGHVYLTGTIVIPAGSQLTKKISLQGEDASLNIGWKGETPEDLKLSLFWLSQDRREVAVIAGESVKKSRQTYKLKAGQIHAIYGRQSAGQFQGIVKKTTVFASQSSDLDLTWSESYGSSSLSGQAKGVKEGQRLCVFAVTERALYSKEIGRDGAFQLSQLPSGQYRVFIGENPYVDWNDALLCSLSKGEKRVLTGPIPRLAAVHGKD